MFPCVTTLDAALSVSGHTICAGIAVRRLCSHRHTVLFMHASSRIEVEKTAGASEPTHLVASLALALDRSRRGKQETRTTSGAAVLQTFFPPNCPRQAAAGRRVAPFPSSPDSAKAGGAAGRDAKNARNFGRLPTPDGRAGADDGQRCRQRTREINQRSHEHEHVRVSFPVLRNGQRSTRLQATCSMLYAIKLVRMQASPFPSA